MDDAVDLELHPNEASDLAVVPAGLVERFDQTFVTVLDEGVIEESIAVLGHRGDDVDRRAGRRSGSSLTPTGNAGKTEDAEACDFFGEHLYVLGSHFGKKDGPLEAKRAWIARVAAADLAGGADGASPPIEIARNRFGLHRALNDRLLVRARAARARAAGAREPRAGDDRARRVEGQELGGPDPRRRPADQHRGLLLPRGRHAAARPALARDRRGRADPRRAAQPRGLLRRARTRRRARRRLDALVRRRARRTRWACARCTGPPDGRLHAIVGSLDALGKDSALVFDHAERRQGALRALVVHAARGRRRRVECVKTHEFPDERSVEGLAKMPSGPFLYVVDRDDNVHLRFLMTEEES